MTFDEILTQITELLQRQGRVSYGAPKRRFGLDEEYLQDLRDELITAQRLAVDEDGKVLVWKDSLTSSVQSPASEGQERVPIPQTLDPRLNDSRPDDAERRQLTVLFCDLVGSTALSAQLDPEEYREVVRAYHETCTEAVRRYEGYVTQHLGDGLLVYFGYPQAHEDDAQRAVRAGLEIVEKLRSRARQQADSAPLPYGRGSDAPQVRIGIHTGLVVIGEIGSSEKREILAMGETPNLAARLQSIAPVNGIAVSEQVRRLAGGAFAYVDLGAQPLKGLSQPVHAYQVVGVSHVASRFEAATHTGLTPLVGREHEIALLRERWQLAQEGEGQVVLLVGEPGIGKSRIASALLEHLAADGVHFLRFQCSPYHVNSAFYPILDNFERALQLGRDETVEAKLDKLEALLADRYGCPHGDVRFVATILSLPCGERYGPLVMTPQKQKAETLRTLVDIVQAAAVRQPTMMLFEDLHWADPTSLEVLDLLIERMRTFPLLLVLTHRPEFPARWAMQEQVTTLNLSKLTRADSSAIVSRLTGGKALPAELLGQILAKTDGVPLFVEELTKALLESGDLTDAGDHYDYVGAKQTVTLPATLRDSLMARLDRVQSVKEIAQIGAVLGREFSYALLAAVAPMPQSEIDRALKQLTDSGLAFRRGAPPEATYTFKHALVQDVAYDSLLKRRRHELHATIARVLAEDFPQTIGNEPELLAHHLTEAGQAAAAIPYWRQAGEWASKRLAFKEAIAHLDQGMTLLGALPPSPERDGQELDLRIRLGTAWIALKGGPAPEVWTSLHPALGLAKSLGRHNALLPIYNGLAMNTLTQGRLTESLAWADDMLATAEANGDVDLLLVAHRTACLVHFWRGATIRSRTHGEKVFVLYNEMKHRYIADLINLDPKTSAGVLVAFGTWMLGYPDCAVQILQDNDVHARRRGHPFDLGWAFILGGLLWDLRREPEPMLVRIEEAERLGRVHSLPFVSEIMAQPMKGIALLRSGRLAEGIPHLRETMEIFYAHGSKLIRPYYRAVLAEGLALSGDPAGGLQLIEESLAQIAQPDWGERWCLAEILRLKGWMLTLQQERQRAKGKNYRYPK